MKPKFAALLTISVALFSPHPGYAQFRPVEAPPVMPMRPNSPIIPPVPPMPLPLDLTPGTTYYPPPPTPRTVNPPPTVYVPPGPSGPAPIPAAPREVNPAPSYVAPVPSEPDRVTGNGGDGPPPMTAEQAFVIAVCANDSDVSSECLQKSGHEAAAQLRWMLLQSVIKHVYSETISIKFPYMTSSEKQSAFLQKIEKVAIAAVQAKIQADIEKLKPFRFDSLGTKARKWEVVQRDQIALNKWNQSARASAQSTSNWSHDWQSQTHTFHEGPAYRQLKQISISGWGGH